jgi:hypothetical protein
VLKAVDDLQRAFNRGKRKIGDVSADIKMLFHERTLTHLVCIKERPLSKPMAEWSSEMFMIAGSLAGIMHDARRSRRHQPVPEYQHAEHVQHIADLRPEVHR